MEKTFQLYYTSDTHGRLFPEWIEKDNAVREDAASCAAVQISASNVLKKSSAAPCLASAFAEYQKDENTLVLDGGDTLQGSPFLRYLWKTNQCAEVLSAVMNSSGMDYYTLGNHDFNYGYDGLAAYVRGMKATCVCANVKDVTTEGEPLDIRPYVIHTLGNGLRIGIVGIVTDWVNVWEAKENLEGLQVTDAFTAAKEALEVLKSVENGVDYTICIYHGGFEASLQADAPAVDTFASASLAPHLCAEAASVGVGSAKQADSDLERREQLEQLEQPEQPEQLAATTSAKSNAPQQSAQPLAPENIACAICKELDFDLLLTAHQHMEQSVTELHGTAVLQLPPNAEKYAKVAVAVNEETTGEACVKTDGISSVSGETSKDCARDKVSEAAVSASIGKPNMDKRCKRILRAEHIVPTAAPSEALLLQMQPYRRAAAQWLAQPAGSLANPVLAQHDKIALALGAAPLAQLANFAQLNASGAEVAITSLPNHACALPKEITVGDLLTAYPFPNAVMTLAVTGEILAKGIARSASYFAKTPSGDLRDVQGAQRSHNLQNAQDVHDLQVAPRFTQPKEEHYNYDFFAGVSYTISFAPTPTVTEILVNGAPLDPARTYTVVMSDYRASGTGGYPFYASCQRLASHPVDLQALLLETLAQHPRFEIPMLSQVKVACE